MISVGQDRMWAGVKVNVDGAVDTEEGVAATGGVFRSHLTEIFQGKDHIDPPESKEAETNSATPQPRKDTTEQQRPPPPFPQRLRKQKQEYQYKKFFDILKHVHVNLPLVEALQKMPNYAKFLKDMVSRKTRIGEFETAAATEACLAMMNNKVPSKKTDPGSFTIPCSIGNNYTCKALCDPGASINLMPKSVFQKLGIGEAKPTTVMLQLADRSTNRKPNCGRKKKAQLNQPAQIPASADIQADIYLTAGTHNRERRKFSRPETVVSQIRVRSASTASSELGRQLMLPNFILTLPAHYKNPAFTIHFCLHLPSSCTPNSPSQKFLFLADMENSQASFVENLPTRFQNIAARTRYYNVVAQKKIWEEQGFFFDDGAENYGLETIIYRRLLDLGWFCLGRKAAQANLSWVREFYAHNAAGNDAIEVRGRRIPANSATINSILDLPNNLPSIYELIGALEEEDLDNIKDQLCLHGTEWNTTGKNPGTISRSRLLPEAKLWNTFVKRNIMSTSHNQTVDRTRLMLINAIISGYRFNVGEVIAKELSDSCQNDKGILAFPCIISALCHRAAVPSRPSDKFTPLQSGWTRKEYMRKMELTDATLIQVAMPTPSASHQSLAVEPQAPTPAANIPDSLARTPEAAASFVPTPPSPPTTHSPSPAPATETPQPTHIMQLRN
ncbi:hypothetical protein V6N12_003086 [Hibiscus sabdariffa]|uniref:Putative plant transposon protein domain-containing protein n=1 Tax=Hibiscus sabdariffa TaxID=183260 RepID=A0ABR2ECL6_9ROSI